MLCGTFVSDFFPLVKCFQGSSMVWHVSAFCSFLWLHNIPQYEQTTFLKIYSSVDGPLDVSTSGPL